MTPRSARQAAYYINTKVGRYNPDVLEMFDFSAERVTRSVDESLERLGLERVPLLAAALCRASHGCGGAGTST